MGEVKTGLRLPDELYAEIKRIADEELRSINAQMVALLREAVEQHPPRQTRPRREERHLPGDVEE